MVFFICDKCGESQKKNQVEGHYFRCRSHSFSCMDCNAVFVGDSYKQHIKCISEDQKYGGKNFVAKENKGETKQAEWTDQVERAIDKVSDPMLKSILVQIKGFTNIPRKEAKFINFLKNSARVRNADLCSRAWQAIASEAKAQTASSSVQNGTNKNNNNSTNNADNKNNGSTSKETNGATANGKRKLSSDENDGEEAESTKKLKSSVSSTDDESNSRFKWKATIKRTLKSAPDHQMRLKKFTKAVIDSYRLATGDSDTPDESLIDSLNAKLEGNQKIQIDQKTVRLVA